MLFEKQILIRCDYGVEQYENSASEVTRSAAADDSKGHKDPFGATYASAGEWARCAGTGPRRDQLLPRAHYCEPADDSCPKSSPRQPAAKPSAGLTVRPSESGDADDWLKKAEHRTAAAIWRDHLDRYMIAPNHPEEQAPC